MGRSSWTNSLSVITKQCIDDSKRWGGMTTYPCHGDTTCADLSDHYKHFLMVLNMKESGTKRPMSQTAWAIKYILMARYMKVTGRMAREMDRADLLPILVSQ